MDAHAVDVISVPLSHSARGRGLLASKHFGHLVESTASPEPVNLGLVVAMNQFKLVRATVLVLENTSDGLARGKVCQADEGNPVIRANLVIVCRVAECEGKHALFLQVGLCRGRTQSLVVGGQVYAADNPPWILAKDLTITAAPPRCRGSKAACSRLLPSP